MYFRKRKAEKRDGARKCVNVNIEQNKSLICPGLGSMLSNSRWGREPNRLIIVIRCPS